MRNPSLKYRCNYLHKTIEIYMSNFIKFQQNELKISLYLFLEPTLKRVIALTDKIFEVEWNSYSSYPNIDSFYIFTHEKNRIIYNQTRYNEYKAILTVSHSFAEYEVCVTACNKPTSVIQLLTIGTPSNIFYKFLF